MSHPLTNESPDFYFLDRESDAARTTLESGFYTEAGKLIPVRAADLIRRGEGHEEILFRRITPVPPHDFRTRVSRFFVAIRAFSLSATLMPCLGILAEGFYLGWKIDGAIAASALLGVLSFQVAVNLHNDVSDYLKLIDLPGSPGGSGVFEKGWYTPHQIRNRARIALGIGCLAGLPALFAYPIPILVAGTAGILGALLYSHESFGLKYHGLGDVAVFLLCGPALTAGFAMAAFGTFSPGVWPIGAVLGLLACALLHMNNLHDMDLDRSRGVSTFAIVIGFNHSVHLLAALYVLAAGIVFMAIFLKILPFTALLILPAFVPAIRLVRRVYGALGPSSPVLEGSRMAAAQIHLLAGILLATGIAGSRIWME